MNDMDTKLPFSPPDANHIVLAAVDLSVARAFWEGVPTARLLARIRLDRDERDLVDPVERASGVDLSSSTWDTLMGQLLAESVQDLARVKRCVTRHGRAASDEGPLAGGDHVVAALVHALLSAPETDADASPGEGAAASGIVAPEVRRACGRLDDRLAMTTTDRRAAAFEACLELAALHMTGPVTVASLRGLGDRATCSLAPLYPWGERDVPIADRRALLLDRAAIPGAAPVVGPTLEAFAPYHGSLIAFARQRARSYEAFDTPPNSWLPADLASAQGAARLATSIERGATSAPRARALILRGGDAALDAVGAEMLDVAAHPFASAVFADVLGRASRERDVVRLVSYFAIAPDVSSAAHALALCKAPEISTVLRAWLESLAPSRTGPISTTKPDVAAPADAPSGSARVEACVAALAPYPHLHRAVQTLVAKRSSAYPSLA